MFVIFTCCCQRKAAVIVANAPPKPPSAFVKRMSVALVAMDLIQLPKEGDVSVLPSVNIENDATLNAAIT